jgi:hypothetical protein
MAGRIGSWDITSPYKELHDTGTISLEDSGDRAWGSLLPDAVEVGTRAQSRQATANGSVGFTFSFSANTRVIFMADGSIDTTPYSGAGSQYATASIYAVLFGPEGPVTSSAGLTSGYGEGLRSSLLELTFRSGTDPLNGDITMDVFTWTEISPVPEPAQVSLLLAGCCALAFAGYRRRQHPARQLGPRG